MLWYASPRRRQSTLRDEAGVCALNSSSVCTPLRWLHGRHIPARVVGTSPRNRAMSKLVAQVSFAQGCDAHRGGLATSIRACSHYEGLVISHWGMELTQNQYERIAHLLPVQRGNVSIPNLQVLNAILYVAGCKWRGLSVWQMATIYTRMNRWAKNGVLDRVFDAATDSACQAQGGLDGQHHSQGAWGVKKNGRLSESPDGLPFIWLRCSNGHDLLSPRDRPTTHRKAASCSTVWGRSGRTYP